MAVPRTWPFLLPALFALAVLLAVLGAGVLAAHIGNGQDLVLVRNSLVYELVHDPQRFTRAPREAAATPAAATDLSAAVAGLGIGSGQDVVDSVVALVRHLDAPGAPRGGRIAEATAETYRRIRASGEGYCADYTQVLVALAAAAGLQAREWGISFEGYSGDGHAVVEVYDPARAQWLFVDPFNGFMVNDERGRPLSFWALRQRLRDGQLDRLELAMIGDVLPFRSPRAALEYLAAGMNRAYLWVEPMPGGAEDHALVAAAGRVSRAAGQLAAIALGVHPRMLIAYEPDQAAALGELRRLRAAAFACAGGGLTTLLVGGWWLLRRRTPGR